MEPAGIEKHLYFAWMYVVCTWLLFEGMLSGFCKAPSITMASVSTVQPSINLVFLFTDKNLKMPLYTLLKVSESTDFQI